MRIERSGPLADPVRLRAGPGYGSAGGEPRLGYQVRGRSRGWKLPVAG